MRSTTGHAVNGSRRPPTRGTTPGKNVASSAAPNDMPLKLEMYGPAQVFYVWPITDAQAGKFAAWVDAEGGIGKEPGSFFLSKIGSAYVYHWTTHDFLVDAAFESAIAERAKRLSAEVFGGAPVEVHLCDQELKTLRVAKDR